MCPNDDCVQRRLEVKFNSVFHFGVIYEKCFEMYTHHYAVGAMPHSERISSRYRCETFTTTTTLTTRRCHINISLALVRSHVATVYSSSSPFHRVTQRPKIISMCCGVAADVRVLACPPERTSVSLRINRSNQ